MTRQLTEEVIWINESHGIGAKREHVSVYLISHEAGNILIDSGSFYHRAEIKTAINRVTSGEGIDALMLSHTDFPHSGNVSAFLDTWGDVELIASSGAPEVQGLPEDAIKCNVGGELEIQNRSFSFIAPPLVDRSHTTWIHDHGSGVLFSIDGFGSLHYPNDWNKMANEIESGIDFENIYEYHKDTFVWLRYAESEKLERALRAIIETFEPRYIAPVHGHPIPVDEVDRYMERLAAAVEQIAGEYSVGEYF